MIVCPWKELGRYAPIIPGLEEALNVVASLPSMEPATYPLSNGGRIMVQQGTTKSAEGALSEAHKKMLDIQYIVKGQEVVGWASLEKLTLSGEFNETKDVGKYSGHVDHMVIGEGCCYVVFPEDAHMPGVYLTQPNEYQKIVVKLPV